MASSPRGRSVQILRINDDGSWQLELDELKSILHDERVKDKPVVVISIAGAYRQGKSFLMNFLLRYMHRQGRQNWLGGPREPLRGFGWKHSRERQTSGIRLWSEVFLVRTSSYAEYDIEYVTWAVLVCSTKVTRNTTTK
ncbi:hypothetical protein MTO96_050258 [Rhipicephalus appendiculatus]